MNTINDLITVVTVGAPARHRSLSVYPLQSLSENIMRDCIVFAT